MQAGDGAPSSPLFLWGPPHRTQLKGLLRQQQMQPPHPRRPAAPPTQDLALRGHSAGAAGFRLQTPRLGPGEPGLRCGLGARAKCKDGKTLLTAASSCLSVSYVPSRSEPLPLPPSLSLHPLLPRTGAPSLFPAEMTQILRHAPSPKAKAKMVTSGTLQPWRPEWPEPLIGPPFPPGPPLSVLSHRGGAMNRPSQCEPPGAGDRGPCRKPLKFYLEPGPSLSEPHPEPGTGHWAQEQGTG